VTRLLCVRTARQVFGILNDRFQPNVSVRRGHVNTRSRLRDLTYTPLLRTPILERHLIYRHVRDVSVCSFECLQRQKADRHAKGARSGTGPTKEKNPRSPE